MLNEIYKDAEGRMKKAVDSFSHEIASVRTGKATPKILDGIKVDYYDTPTPLNQLASISAPDPKSLLIQPWEKTVIPDIIKALHKADLGLNPMAEANIIRVPVPPLNEERRKEMVKLVKKLGEDGKIAIRNIRRDANDKLKKAEKDSAISEDDLEKGQKKIQEFTDDYIKIIAELVERKEKEVMEV
jgi:ribosome recycling factor